VTSSEESRCSQARQFCRELRGCAGHVLVAHVRERRKFNHEQEDLEVRGGVGLTNQFGSIISSHDPRHLATSALHHPRGLPLRPSSTCDNPSRQTSSSSTESRHRQVLLIANSIRHGTSLSVCSSSTVKTTPRFALFYRIFLKPAIRLPEYRR
jgi:hypothetical protein